MVKGFSDVLVGLQFGDEGKARIIDNIAHEYDVIARFNGGANAGHTVEVDGKKIVLHQIPSGIFHEKILLYVGSGCVVNPEKFFSEINDVESLGINLEGRLQISNQATFIQPHHILLDKITGKEIGTTVNGIGPAYADQALRSYGKVLKNLRIGDCLEDLEFSKITVLENYFQVLAEQKLFVEENEVNTKVENFIEVVKNIGKYVCSNPLWLDNLARSGKKILFEGAQASMLDVVKGTVPFVTSSHTISGNAYVGGDLSPNYHRKTIGVAKALMSRVGNGPFVSEFGGIESEIYCAEDDGRKHNQSFEEGNYFIDELFESKDFFNTGIALRILGKEYGATTKRPRRIGMLDLTQLSHTCRINGVDELYLNKVDCLTDFSRTNLEGIPLVVAYDLDGQMIDYVPGSNNASRKAKPVIEFFPKIKQDLSKMKTFEELPEEAKTLLKKIEEKICCKIAGIGVGPSREQFIKINN